MRKLKYTLGTIVGMVFVAIIMVTLLIITEFGSRWLIQNGMSRFSKDLEINRIQGTLADGLILNGIEYRNDKQHTRIEQVNLIWKPLSLLRGDLHLQSLDIEGITCTAIVNNNTPSRITYRQLPNISFPITIFIEDATLKRLVFRQGDIKYFLDQVHLIGKAERDYIRFKHLVAEGKNLFLDLKGNITLSQPFPFKAQLNWNVRLSDSVKGRGQADISGNINTIKLTHKLREPFSFDTQGEVKISHLSHRSQFDGNQQILSRFLPGEATGYSGQSKYHSQDIDSLFQLIFRGDFQGRNLPPMQIKAIGRGNLKSFQIEKLDAHMLGGVVKVNGDIVWQSKPMFKLMVNAMNIDPAKQWPGWPGELSLKAQVQSDIDTGTPAVLIDELSLTGTLLEQPFQMKGDVALFGKNLAFENLEIHSGQNRLNVNGSANTHLDLKFKVNLPDPDSLWPGFKGILRGKGTLKGARRNPNGSIAFKGINVNYGNYTVENLDANLTLDLNDMSRSNAKIKMLNLHIGNEVFPSLLLNWAGDFKNHRINAKVVSDSASAKIELAGRSHKDIWELNVNTASFNLRQHGIWRLLNTLNLQISNTDIKHFNACWVMDNSRKCIQASWNNVSGWKAVGDVNAPPLSHMVDLMKEFFKKENLGWTAGAY